MPQASAWAGGKRCTRQRARQAAYLFIPFLLLILLAPPESAFAKKGKGQPVIATTKKQKSAASASASAIRGSSKTVTQTRSPIRKQTLAKAAERGSSKTVKQTGSQSRRVAVAQHPGGLRPPLTTISACSAMIMDAESGEVIYAKAPDLPLQPASTIKVLTGLMALESLNDEDSVRVSSYAADMPSSKVNLEPGRLYRAGDLINAVLLASANDASVALAEKIAGSEAKFAELMTCKARALGATHTVCKTANGLTVEGQQTTARDLAVIFNKAMASEGFAERVRRVTVKTRDGKMLKNHNKALWSISGAEGGKTGYTIAAKKTYVGKFKRGGDSLLVSVMGSESMWNDVRSLVEYGFAAKHQPKLASNQAGPALDAAAEKPASRSLPRSPVLQLSLPAGSKRAARL